MSIMATGMLDADNVASVPIEMRNRARDDHWTRRLAFPASLVVHLLIVALLMFGLPESLPQPQNEEAISVELVPPPEQSKGQAEPYPVLQPVIQFGEKDAGPKVSADGNSATDNSPSPTAPSDPDQPDKAQPPATATASTSDTPELVEQDPSKAQRALKLRQAKTLFSQRATGHQIATIAMGPVTREMRVARLCATELKEQLRHATPSYFAEILPFDRLKEGTVVENLSAAFRSNWEWYNLSYRCEVDPEATKVVSFAFDIGDRLTPDEWRRRRLPSN